MSYASRSQLTRLIGNVLADRHPTGEYSRGDLREVAREFGATDQAVYLLAKRLGMRRVVKARPARLCAGCGVRLKGKKREVCRTCAWVELPCDYCAQPVRRRTRQLETRLERAVPNPNGPGTITSKGRVFCNKKCFGAWLGTHHGGSNRATSV
jgi:hypothetical protein